MANNISTFQPFDLENQFIDFTRSPAVWKESINEFFIHALHDKTINLRLPLPPHKKTVHDFLIVIQGYAERQVGISKYKINTNELLSVPKLEVSTTDYYSDDLNGFYCHFSDKFLDENTLLINWKLKNGLSNKITLRNDGSTRINQLLRIINNLYKKNWEQNKALIAQYLRTVMTEIISQEKDTVAVEVNKQREITEAYIKLININLHNKPSINELAEMLNISPNHLNKTVKKHLGKSAQSVYNEIMIQEAKVLLLQTSKDIGEIALDLGFNDLSYFGRFFKKQTQQSPKIYREMIEKHQ